MNKKKYYYPVYFYNDEYLIENYFNHQKEMQFEMGEDISSEYNLPKTSLIKGSDSFYTIKESKELLKKAKLISKRYTFESKAYNCYVNNQILSEFLVKKYEKAYTLKKALYFFEKYRPFLDIIK